MLMKTGTVSWGCSLVLVLLIAGCSGSSSRKKDSPSTEDTTPKKTFILSDMTADLKTNGGGAHGPDGGDKLCQAEADANSLGGTYKVLAVDGVNRVACTTPNCSGGVSEHVNWVLKPNTEYLHDDGTTLIGKTDANGLLVFPLDNELTPMGTDFWMGLNTDWTTATLSCTGFTSSNTMASGQIGSSSYKTSGAISSASRPCDYYGTTILCVEQ